MSYGFQIQPGGELVVVAFAGFVSAAEEARAVQEFAALPGLDINAKILVDRRRASISVPASQVLQQIEIVKSTLEQPATRPRMAIIAPRDLDFGLSRMLELRGGDDLPHQIMVVRDLADACAWLDVSADAIVWPKISRQA